VGILEGSDPKLKQEYVVLVAHMDHVGFMRGGGQADSIYNGAVDNVSGAAGIIELREAPRYESRHDHG
jgi:Zn-dependent M28 family amino/carboxypeptidase